MIKFSLTSLIVFTIIATPVLWFSFVIFVAVPNSFKDMLPAELLVTKTVKLDWPKAALIIPTGGGWGCSFAAYRLDSNVAEKIRVDQLHFFEGLHSTRNPDLAEDVVYATWAETPLPSDGKYSNISHCLSNQTHVENPVVNKRPWQQGSFYSCTENACLIVDPRRKLVLLSQR